PAATTDGSDEIRPVSAAEAETPPEPEREAGRRSRGRRGRRGKPTANVPEVHAEIAAAPADEPTPAVGDDTSSAPAADEAGPTRPDEWDRPRPMDSAERRTEEDDADEGSGPLSHDQSEDDFFSRPDEPTAAHAPGPDFEGAEGAAGAWRDSAAEPSGGEMRED